MSKETIFRSVYVSFYITSVFIFCTVFSNDCTFYRHSPIQLNCGGCGFCSPKTLNCEWPLEAFQQVSPWIPNLSKCFVVDFCQTDGAISCANERAECIPMFGTFKCKCDQTRYGRLCENVHVDMKYTDVVVIDDIIFPSIFSVNKFVTVSVFILHEATYLDVTFITRFEAHKFDSSSCKKNIDLSTYCKRWHSEIVSDVCMKDVRGNARRQPYCIVTIQVILPGASFYSYPKEDEIRDDNGLLVAIKGKLGFEIYNGRKPRPSFSSFYNFINLLVSPDINECAPKVYLVGVGETMSNILKLTNVNELTIVGSYELSAFPQCLNVDNVNLHWSVWQLFINHNEVNPTQRFDSPFREMYKEKILVFDPFVLAGGKYKVKLNVTVWQGSEASFDYAFGYFEIQMANLIPVISGGTEKKVYHNTKSITLDGSKSKNLNENPTEEGDSLKYCWTCDQNNKQCQSKCFEHSSITYYGPFDKDTNYVFTLTISLRDQSAIDTPLPQSAHQKIFMSGSPIPFLEILCTRNCVFEKSNPNEKLIFEAIIKDSPEVINLNQHFEWTYKIGSNEEILSVDAIRQKRTSNNVLIIPGKTLEEGMVYTFQVEGGADSPGFAEYKVVMATKPIAITCEYIAADGKGVVYRGITPVSITCLKGSDVLSPIYTMYNKFSEDEADDEARVMYSGKSNIAHNIVLTRDYLTATVTNQYGLVTSVTAKIPLLEAENTVEKHLEELSSLIKNSNSIQRANKIAVVVDFIAEGQFKYTEYIPKTLEFFLKIAAEDEINSLPFLKVWTGSTYLILKEGKKRNVLTMKSMNHLSKVLTNLSNRLLYETQLVIYDFLTQGLTYREIQLYCTKLIRLANIFYNQIDEDFRNKNVKKEQIYSLYTSYRESTDFFMQALEKIMHSLVLNVSPYDLPVTVDEGKMSIWVKEDSPESISELSLDKSLPDSLPSVIITKSLANSVSKQVSMRCEACQPVMLVAQIAQFEGDPYWWDQKVHISTNVVDFKMVFKQKREIAEIREIQYPIQINLKNSFQEITTISGTVEQGNESLSADELDLMVNVHQLRVPQTGRLYVTFKNLGLGQELKVLALFNIRPDYQILLNKGFTINSTSGVYFSPLKDPNNFDIYDLYFLGVIPGPNVPVGTVISYLFELSSSHCSTRTLNEWTTRGCRVVKTSKDKELDCECDHLSIFGGFSQIPMNKVNPFEDYKLFLELPNNPYVFVFILSLLAIYLFLLMWTVRKDYDDRKKEGAIYLEDNFPFDGYPYLLAVYTGNKCFAGTSANVGIAIEGSESASRYHLLRSSMYKTLRTGDDDWFLLFCPNYLGSLKLIDLWSDYSGWGPEWYCSKIIIVDLLDNKEYKFIVESWLSLKRGQYIERCVHVCPPEDDQRLIVTVDNMIFGFRETHLWVSVMSRHPRSTVSRAKRLTVAFGGLMITMLVSCMFYGVLDETVEDQSEYTATSREVVIGFVSVIITALFINLLVSVFRRSFVFKITDEAEIEEDDNDSDKVEKRLKGSKERNSNKKTSPREEPHKTTMYKFFEQILKALAAKKRFVPVELNIEILGQPKHHSYHFRRIWSYISWIICISIILICSYLIMLYAFKFGTVKSLQWLTSISFGFLHMFFIATPMKIIALSTMSGMLASNLYEVVTYRINYEMLMAYRGWYLENHPDLEDRLISLRKQRAYFPLSHLDVISKTSWERKKEAVYTLIEMILIAAVLVLTFTELDTLWTTTHFWNNHQLAKLLRGSYEEEGIQLRTIRNISNYPAFLRTDVFPVIYRTTWYNNQPFVKGSTSDFRFVFSGTSKIVGLPRIRQLRIKPGLCKKNQFVNLTDLCLVTLSSYTEDNDFYGEGWITSGEAEKFQASPVWSYMNESETVGITLYGYSNAAYEPGGYVAELAMSRDGSDDIVIYLERENWLDRRTKAVIFEFSIYSAFSGTLSWLISITENLHIGVLTNVVHVYSVSQDYGFIPLDFVFLASLLLFAIRVCLNMNRRGVSVIFCDFWTLFEVSLVVLGIVCAILLSQNIFATEEYVKKFFVGADREKHFEFLHLVRYLLELRIVLIFLILLIVCRFMKSWIRGKDFINYYRTLGSCWKGLLWIFIIFFLAVFSYWRVFSYLLNSFMFVKNNFVLISKIDFKLIVSNCFSVTCKINPYVLCTFSSIVTMIIIMYFVLMYRIIKKKHRNEHEDINICSVFCKKNTNIPFRNNKQRNPNWLRLN